MISHKQKSNQNIPALKADLVCKGMWETEMKAWFDICVIDADATYYVSL